MGNSTYSQPPAVTVTIFKRVIACGRLRSGYVDDASGVLAARRVGTGVTHSVEWAIYFVFSELGLDWRQHIIFSPSLRRLAGLNILKADFTRITAELGWRRKTGFEEVLKMMIRCEMERA